MRKEELIKKESSTQKELCENLIDFFEFEKASKEEVKNWPYKSELVVSLKNIIDKEVFVEDEYIGIIEDCFLGKSGRGHISVRIKVRDKEFSLTGAKVKMYDKFSEKEILVDLHPARKGIKFWSFGHILSEKDYKSLYYKTKEYRSQYEKSLNESLGTTGLKAPIQSKKIKDKISKTMDDRYGVGWFLERGCHYSAVTMTMQDKFGVDNLFYSYEWQLNNAKKINKNFNETSKLENELSNELDLIFDCGKSFHKTTENGQKIIPINKNKFYKLDYYNSEYNFVIEVMGDYWHCNPNIYNHDFYHKNKNKLASDIWEDDRKRKNEIINATNCSYIEIWEKDWKYNRESVLEYIKSQIKSHKQ